MATTIFYSETSLNGKYQVMTNGNLTGRGVKKVASNCITTQKGAIYSGLNRFWVSAQVLEDLKKNNNTERACF